MKKVINIYTLELCEVDDDAIECSVCGEYKPRSDYSKNNHIVRTNCLECYNTPIEKYDEMKKFVEHQKGFNRYYYLTRAIEQQKEYKENCISVREMIEALQKISPDAKLVIFNRKYPEYLADIHLPFLIEDRIELDDDYYSIGSYHPEE